MTYQMNKAQNAAASGQICILGKQHFPTSDHAADAVLSLVSEHTHVSTDLLLRDTRCQAPIAHSRQMAMYLMHTFLGRTLSAVGRYFGRDRTTIAHACGRIEDRRDDFGFDAELAALEERLALMLEASSGAVEEQCDAWH